MEYNSQPDSGADRRAQAAAGSFSCACGRMLESLSILPVTQDVRSTKAAVAEGGQGAGPYGFTSYTQNA